MFSSYSPNKRMEISLWVGGKKKRRIVITHGTHQELHTISNSFQQTIWTLRAEQKKIFELQWKLWIETKSFNYCGWHSGTSNIRSGGYSNISGLEKHKSEFKVTNHLLSNYSCPLAERTSGKISNSVLCGFHPSFRQTCINNLMTIHQYSEANEFPYISDFDIHWVACETSIRVQVACIRYQLGVPNAKVMLAIGSLWKYRDCRSENRKQQLTCCTSPINHVSFPIPMFAHRKFPLFVLYFKWLHKASNICEGVDSCRQSNTCW
jgi:hypothetical protein